MNDAQFYIAVGLPTLTVLVGIFLNQRSIDRLESNFGIRMGQFESRMDRLESRFERIEARLDRIEADLREFYRTLGQHEARLDNLEKGRL